MNIDSINLSWKDNGGYLSNKFSRIFGLLGQKYPWFRMYTFVS